MFDSGDAARADHRPAYPDQLQRQQHQQHPRQPQRRQGPRAGGRHRGALFGRTYIFVVLERIGGVMVYDVSDPAAPTFVQYINTRNSARPATR